MKAFMDKDFLLESDTARELFAAASTMPILIGIATCRPRKYTKTARPRT